MVPCASNTTQVGVLPSTSRVLPRPTGNTPEGKKILEYLYCIFDVFGPLECYEEIKHFHWNRQSNLIPSRNEGAASFFFSQVPANVKILNALEITKISFFLSLPITIN